MKYVYPATFYLEDDGRYTVEVPDFPLATFGDNLADAMYMASDAVAGRILLMLKDGETLPKPSDIREIRPDDDSGFVSMLCIDIEAAKSFYDESPVKKTLSIPSWLNKAAERQNINFSATLREALIERLTQ